MSYDENRISDQIDGGLAAQKEQESGLLNMAIHLTTMMSVESANLFMSEIIKSLNEITFNGERKIIAVRKYGNAIAVTLEQDKFFPKQAYNFQLATKQAEVVLDNASDSKCKKNGVVFDYINGNPICPICAK